MPDDDPSNDRLTPTFVVADGRVDASGAPLAAELRIDLGELFERWGRVGQGGLVGAAHISGTTQITVAGGTQAEITGVPLAGEELVEVVVEIL